MRVFTDSLYRRTVNLVLSLYGSMLAKLDLEELKQAGEEILEQQELDKDKLPEDEQEDT